MGLHWDMDANPPMYDGSWRYQSNYENEIIKSREVVIAGEKFIFTLESSTYVTRDTYTGEEERGKPFLKAGFSIPKYGINRRLEPKDGVISIACKEDDLKLAEILEAAGCKYTLIGYFKDTKLFKIPIR